MNAKVQEHIQIESYLLHEKDVSNQDEILNIMNKPFDLSHAPLWRYAMVAHDNGDYDLIVSFHHLIVDGTSIELILKELSDFLEYGSLPSPLTEPYSKYVEMQESIKKSEIFLNQRNWWLKKFETLPEQLNLETDAVRKEVSDFSGKHYYFQIDTSLYQQTSKCIAQMHTTPFVFYLATLGILLQKASKQNDFCIGIPVDQRIKGDFANTIGMFAQSLPIRLQIKQNQSFIDYLGQVQEICFDSIENSMYSYDELVQELDIKKDFSRNALFDVMFTYTNAKNREHQYGDVKGITQEFGTKYSPFELSLELTERDGGLYGDLNYASPLFSDSRVEKMMNHFSQMIQNIILNPQINVNELSIISNESRDKLLAMGQGNVDYENTKSTLELFSEAFEKYKSDVAICFGDEDITYGALKSQVDRLASFLVERGLKKGDLVGILIPIQPAYISLMLAIQQIGCAWLPMDVNYPANRIQYMIENSKVKAVVSEEQYREFVNPDVPFLLVSEAEDAEINLPEMQIQKDDLVYVIYTSGSSGNPKGVMLSNGALANFLIGMKEALGWETGKRVSCMTTPSFDIFHLETLLTLAYGGCIVLAQKEETLDPHKIASLIVDKKVDYMQITPTRLRLLNMSKTEAQKVYQSLEKIIIGGEQFPDDLLSTLQEHKNLQIFNVYGPTETCIWSTVKEMTCESTVNIGKPIRNTAIYILDDNFDLVPEENSGNLWIGGMGVANGYLNNECLTKERFVPNPFGEGRIYNTGDQAMWKNDELYCLGRNDNQVKIRGYRIELEEIEQVIVEHEMVISAAVTTMDCGNKNIILIGVYQLARPESIKSSDLKKWLAERLPEYMIPATLKEVKHIPQTQNGKVDRNEIVKLCSVEGKVEDSVQEVSELGNELIRIWKKILGNVDIGYHDTFFDVGGNSYSIILLHAELEKKYPDVFEVTDLFANPTISRQMRFMEAYFSQQTNGIMQEGIYVAREWLNETALEAGSMEAEIPEAVLAKLEQLKQVFHCETEHILTSLFAIYLGKALEQDKITLYVLVNRQKIVPVELDFAKESYLQNVIQDYVNQIKDSNKYVSISDVIVSDKKENEIFILCGNRYMLEKIKATSCFDLKFMVSEQEQALVAGIDYTGTIKEEVVKKQLIKYVQFMGLITSNL